jgi:hypothetical protein
MWLNRCDAASRRSTTANYFQASYGKSGDFRRLGLARAIIVAGPLRSLRQNRATNSPVDHKFLSLLPHRSIQPQRCALQPIRLRKQPAGAQCDRGQRIIGH